MIQNRRPTALDVRWDGDGGHLRDLPRHGIAFMAALVLIYMLVVGMFGNFRCR